MKYWVDDKSGCVVSEPDRCDEWLSLIWMIGCDYDGCNTVKSLQELVDELVEMSQKARNCLHEGRLFKDDEEELRRYKKVKEEQKEWKIKNDCGR